MQTRKILFVSLITVLLLDCCSTNRPAMCEIESLIIDGSLFPEGTYIEPLVSPIPEKPKESAGRSYYYAPYDIFQMVIRWRSDKASKREFEDYVETAFDVDKYMGPWEILDTLYVSHVADNYHVACGLDHKIYQCRMAASYDEYSVFFRADVSGQGITISKVNDLLKIIDKRMAECIN